MIRDNERLPGPRRRRPQEPRQYRGASLPSSVPTVDEIFELTAAGWGVGLVHHVATVAAGARPLDDCRSLWR